MRVYDRYVCGGSGKGGGNNAAVWQRLPVFGPCDAERDGAPAAGAETALLRAEGSVRRQKVCGR